MNLRNWNLCWLAISLLTVHQLLPTVSIADDEPKPDPSVRPGQLGSDVNPFIGTGGVTYLCANNFPGATVPFGMMRLSPDTISPLGKRAINSSGYYYPDDAHSGFQPHETGGNRRHRRREFSRAPL